LSSSTNFLIKPSGRAFFTSSSIRAGHSILSMLKSNKMIKQLFSEVQHIKRHFHDINQDIHETIIRKFPELNLNERKGKGHIEEMHSIPIPGDEILFSNADLLLSYPVMLYHVADYSVGVVVFSLKDIPINKPLVTERGTAVFRNNTQVTVGAITIPAPQVKENNVTIVLSNRFNRNIPSLAKNEGVKDLIIETEDLKTGQGNEEASNSKEKISLGSTPMTEDEKEILEEIELEEATIQEEQKNEQGNECKEEERPLKESSEEDKDSKEEHTDDSRFSEEWIVVDADTDKSSGVRKKEPISFPDLDESEQEGDEFKSEASE